MHQRLRFFISLAGFTTAALINLNALSQSSLQGLVGLEGGLNISKSQTTASKTKSTQAVSPRINLEFSSMNDFLTYEKKCKSGDSNPCLYAGKIMMLDRPPQEIYDGLSSTTRANRAIRFYESAISINNNLEAMELAYDLYYDENIINRQINSYTDKDRAKELLDQMIVENYPGGLIRQARGYIQEPEYFLSIDKKKEACATARNLATQPNLSPSTKSNVDNILKGNACSLYGN